MSAIPSPISIVPSAESERISFDEALARISSRAHELDVVPRLPSENLGDLRAAGMLQLPADRAGAGAAPLREEIALVRAIARADASTARIFDGHLNGVERLALGAPTGLREAELARIAAGKLLLGVWGADPAPGEGEPARVVRGRNGSVVLRGVKTFCSGAGGVQRALVVVRDGGEQAPSAPVADGGPQRLAPSEIASLDERRSDSAGAPPGERRLAYVDTSEGLEIDRAWYRASGLRSSESHRVVFDDTPVLALLGGENELARQPFFARDGVRTAATWAGIADGIFAAATGALGEREPDEHQLSALGRMRVARGTIDRWLEHAGAALEDEDVADPAGLATSCRAAIVAASRTIAEEAAQACGSRSLIAGGALDRGRRDLDLFILQHRLEPQLAKLGRSTLDAAPGPR
jgi:alkylation response protein AidB-like acyl-CoA dehydrogenase